MSTLGKLVLGAMGSLHPCPSTGDATAVVYVADHARMKRVPAAQRAPFASVAAGTIAQNIYLFAASAGLGTVLRAWIDRGALARALGLTHGEEVLLSQTVGLLKEE